MDVFEPLVAWQALTGKSDADVGRLLGCSRWKISRAKKGDLMLPIEDQIALEAFTGIKPAQWTAWYEKRARSRSASQKKSLVAGEAA